MEMSLRFGFYATDLVAHLSIKVMMGETAIAAVNAAAASTDNLFKKLSDLETSFASDGLSAFEPDFANA